MTVEEIQAFIQIAQKLALELLAQRGLTAEQLVELRKKISEQLISDIDAELAKFDTNPEG